MKLTLQQLETHLWGAANILRGKTTGQDDKNYILSLMFYKRLRILLRNAAQDQAVYVRARRISDRKSLVMSVIKPRKTDAKSSRLPDGGAGLGFSLAGSPRSARARAWSRNSGHASGRTRAGPRIGTPSCASRSFDPSGPRT